MNSFLMVYLLGMTDAVIPLFHVTRIEKSTQKNWQGKYLAALDENLVYLD